MSKKIMKIKRAGSTPPPPKLAKKISKLENAGERSPEKVWKKLLATFIIKPTVAQFESSKKKIFDYYAAAAKEFEKRKQKELNNPLFQAISSVDWERRGRQEFQKYYVLVIMSNPGPGNTSVNPPQKPSPPQSPL